MVGLGWACEDLLEEVPEGEIVAVDRQVDQQEASVSPPSALDAVTSVDEQARDLALRPLGNGSFVRETTSGRRVATIAADGTVAFESVAPTSPRPGVAIPGLGEAGRHQNSISRTRFLQQTAEFRGRLQAVHTRKLATTQLANLPTELRGIWGDKSRPAKERRNVLFQRWDETFDPSRPEAVRAADPSARALARIRAEATTATRIEIERFIRTELPAGSPDAYPDSELKALNDRRTGGRQFAPYATSEGPRPSPQKVPVSAPDPSLP